MTLPNLSGVVLNYFCSMRFLVWLMRRSSEFWSVYCWLERSYLGIVAAHCHLETEVCWILWAQEEKLSRPLLYISFRTIATLVRWHFLLGVSSTNVTVSSEKSKHFYVKLFGDVIARRWIPKFTCLKEGRLTCLCLGIKEILN